jgi:hypothetical protein
MSTKSRTGSGCSTQRRSETREPKRTARSEFPRTLLLVRSGPITGRWAINFRHTRFGKRLGWAGDPRCVREALEACETWGRQRSLNRQITAKSQHLGRVAAVSVVSAGLAESAWIGAAWHILAMSRALDETGRSFSFAERIRWPIRPCDGPGTD